MAIDTDTPTPVSGVTPSNDGTPQGAEHATSQQNVLETEVAASEKGLKGFGAKVARNAKSPGFVGKAKVFLGGAFALGLLYSAYKDLTAPTTDDKGQPVEGKKLIGIVKLLGAGAAGLGMSHGGGMAR